MGKKMFKRFMALCMAVVLTLGSSLAVFAAPAASPTYGVKLTSTSANYHAKTITVKYSDTGVQEAGKYRVAYRYRSNSNWTKWYYVTTTDKFKTISKLNNSLYEFKVAPVSGNKVGEYSNVSRRFIVAVTPTVKANGNGSITVTAKRPWALTGYRIYWSTNKNMSGALTRNVSTKGDLKNTIKASLKKGKTYYVRVVPICKLGGETYLGVYNTTRTIKVK